MKQIKCKKCGNEYPKKLKKCPQCNRRTPRLITAIISIIICCIIGGIAIGSIDTSTPTQTGSSADTKATSQTTTNSSKKQSASNNSKDKVIYSDSDLKITYKKVSDGKDLGVTACYIHLKVENLSSKTVNVTLTDAYANDTSVTVMSGLPMKLAPGKNSQTPFLFGYNEIFTSADDVETLEFKVKLFSEDFTEVIKTTKSIKIKVK